MAPVNAFPCGTPPNETCCRVGWICRGGVCSPPDVDGGIGRIVALRGGDNVIVNGDVYKLGAILHHGDSIFLGSSGATTATIFVTLESGGPFTLILHAGGQVKLPPAPPSPVERIFQLPQGLMRGIDRGLPAQNQFEVEALNSVLGVEGTDFTIEADPDRLLDTVVVYEGAVLVTPKNPALAPVRLEAGQQIAVSPDTIGPALPCLPEECNDGEPCSADACTPAGCQNVPVTGFEAACSACQGGLGSPSCAGESVPPGIGKRIALACSLREQAATNPDGAKKLLRRAKGALKSGRAKARKAANRQTNPLDAACASAITGALRPPF
jgi:hypothetical protein